MKEKMLRIFKVVLPALVVVGAFLAGVVFATSSRLEAGSVTVFLNQEQGKPEAIDFAAFWKVWNLVDKNYVSTATTSTSTPVSSQDRVWGAIQGMVDSLNDPYSNFLPPDDNKAFAEEISGNFGGIGIEIGIRDKALTVIAPLPNTPAKAAGIEAGDKIVEIDGKPAAQISTTEAIKLIRGEIGTKVKLTVLREEEKASPRVVELTRANIEVPTMETENLPGGITHIKLFNFGATAPEAFKKALQGFVASGNDKLILDLRGNPGGYMDGAVEVASWFLPEGTPIVIEQRGEGSALKIYRSVGYKLLKSKPKMVILVDEGSASASEIVAGALSEHGVAKLVGEQTFGKGSVQELFPITRDTSLKLTIAKWFTPNGISISQNGLKPAVEVKMEGAATSTDPQLDAAIKEVKKLK